MGNVVKGNVLLRIVFVASIVFFTIVPLTANTIKSNYSGDWGQSGIWDSKTVPGLNDDVIISANDTVYMNPMSRNFLVNCNSLTVYGTLILGNGGDYYFTHLNINKSFSIANFGIVKPVLDTTVLTRPSSSYISIGSDFSISGKFIAYMVNSKAYARVDVDLYGNGTINCDSNYIPNLIIDKNVTLNGIIDCNSLQLAGKLDNSNGSVTILANGSIYLYSLGSITNAPIYKKNVIIIYGGGEITGNELPDSVYELDFGGDITLSKSVTVTHYLKCTANNKALIYTNKDTLTLGDSANTFLNSDHYIAGNLSRVFSSHDSLVFFTGTSQRFRPAIIKLNNLKGEKDTVTVTAVDTPVNVKTIPQSIAAVEKYHYWEIGSSQNYSKNVDANVYLNWYEQNPFNMFADYIGNKLNITVIRGNQTRGEWTDVDNNPQTSYGSYGQLVTGKSFKSFGDFTTAEIYKVPNGDFETWQYGQPYGWKDSNTALAEPVTESSNAHSGSSAVEGDVVTNSNNTSIIVSPGLKIVIPFWKVPNALKGYYQFNSVGNDKFFVDAKLYKDSNIVAEGSFLDSTSSTTYKEFNFNISSLTKTAVDTVDSLSIEVSLKPGNSNQYHIGSSFFVDDFSFGKITDLSAAKNNIPHEFTLYQNYPNPFNPTTKIKFTIPKAGNVNLTVYNILGQKIRELINRFIQAGKHSFEFNGNNLSSGIYFYRLKEDNHTQSRKMILLK